VCQIVAVLEDSGVLCPTGTFVIVVVVAFLASALLFAHVAIFVADDGSIWVAFIGADTSSFGR
jgi:hypothetical protein